jgi:hypothetical protein
MLFFFAVPLYSLAQNDAEAIKSIFSTYPQLNDYKKHLDEIAKKNSEPLTKNIRKEYSEIVAEKNTDLLKELKENNFLFDTEVTKYLSSVFFHILDKNNLNKNEYHFFVSRSHAINASAYEDGTVICNLGLLNIMESESQVAMVFCHEIAHYLLNHVNNAIVKRIENYNSPEFLAKVKEIKKEKYNTKKQLEELFITDLFNRRRHNRSQELSADSLGLLLFSKTNYGSTAIPHLFDLLNTSDSIVIKTSIKDFCSRENIAADESWFTIRKKMSFGADTKKEIKDTLKTHPDCEVRKIYAEKYFAKNPGAGPDFILSENTGFAKIKQAAVIEEARYSKDKERLSYYLYQLIQNDARFAGNTFIKQEIFELLLSFYLKQKNHTLAYVIDSPYATENSNDEYAKLLKMLDAFDLQKFKEVAINYYGKNKRYLNLNSELNKNFQELNKN